MRWIAASVGLRQVLGGFALCFGEGSFPVPVSDDMEVWARGHGSFFPDVEFGVDVVEEMTITDRQLIVYPEGREVPEHVVELERPDDFTEASAMHMISIEISDDAVEVSGTSVPGRTERFVRR